MDKTWTDLKSQLMKDGLKGHIPVAGTFELTSRCNLECKMCFVRNDANDKEALKKELSAEDWIKIAKDARKAGLLYLTLTGGEVFLRHDFREIYEEVSRLGLVIAILTNGTMISADVAKWLREKPPSVVSITLYGASKSTYEKVCNNGNSYDSVLQGIRNLISEGVSVKLTTTIIKDNVHDFVELADYASSIGVDFNVVECISPRRDGLSSQIEQIRLNPDDFLQFDEFAEKYFRNQDSKRDLQFSKKTDNLQNTGTIDEDLFPFQCYGGRSMFFITYDGRLSPCSLLNDPSVSVLCYNFLDAWKKLYDICSQVPRCTECINCMYKAYCMTCPARLYVETASFVKPAPYFCEIATRISRNIEMKLDKSKN